MQFVDYRDVNPSKLAPFIEKYFSPSGQVVSIAAGYEQKYRFDYSNTCAVFYRGNDKSLETAIGGYDSFIIRAKELQSNNPNITFLVQTDEAEFLASFLHAFPTAIYIDELPRINKQNSVMQDVLPIQERAEFGAKFIAATLVISKCNHLITHSGNGGLWAVLYRGTTKNVYQWLNNSWERSRYVRFCIRTKAFLTTMVRRIFIGNPWWQVVS
jgi:hypothetical protein